MSTSKQILSLSLCVALLIIAGFFILLTSAGDGYLSIAESDQILYLQYAKNMALGNPLVFSPGDTPSSGSTTYLYIILLSWIYRLFTTTNSVLIASYVMNSLFYLGSLVLVWTIAKKIAPKVLWLAMTLSVLSGHTALAMLKQTDIGIFTFLTLALFSSLLYKRRFWAWILIMLCAATRPEGFILSIAFFLSWLIALITHIRSGNLPKERLSYWFLVYSVSGAGIFFITLLVNYALTDQFQFMSVSNKGYFNLYPLTGAIQHTFMDAIALIKGVFLGLQENNRQFYFLPVLAGVFGLSGIVLKKRHDAYQSLCELWFGLGSLGALFLISSSQFAGVSNDRYLGWIIPVWIIYIAYGWKEWSVRANRRSFASICATLLIGFQFISLTNLASEAYGQSIMMGFQKNFSEQIRSTFPPSARFGSTEGNGINFFMPEHKVYNLWGITSPDFAFKREAQTLELNIDVLKHRKDLRFDYWISSQATLKSSPWLTPLLGKVILSDTDMALSSKTAMKIYPAQWELLDGGDSPVLWNEKSDGLQLVDSLDIGYVLDEITHNYQYQLRLKDTVLAPIATINTLDNRDYMEGGRIVLGSESFTIQPVDKTQPLIIVLRTGIKAASEIYFNRQFSNLENLVLNNELNLKVYCDGTEVPCPPLKLNELGFNDIEIEIPAKFITSTIPRITIAGDHISYSYWFYQ